MPQKKNKKKSPTSQNPSPPTQALNWQQELQVVDTAHASASTVPPLPVAALEECDTKFIKDFPGSHLQSPERLFDQIKQVCTRRFSFIKTILLSFFWSELPMIPTNYFMTITHIS